MRRVKDVEMAEGAFLLVPESTCVVLSYPPLVCRSGVSPLNISLSSDLYGRRVFLDLGRVSLSTPNIEYSSGLTEFTH